jgi:hypothetical protein
MPSTLEDADRQAFQPLSLLGLHVTDPGDTAYLDEMEISPTSPTATLTEDMPSLPVGAEARKGGDEAVKLDCVNYVHLLARFCPSTAPADHASPTGIGESMAGLEQGGVLAADGETQGTPPLNPALDISVVPSTLTPGGISVSHALPHPPPQTTAAHHPASLSSSRATSLARTTRDAFTPASPLEPTSNAPMPHKFIDLVAKERQTLRPEPRSRTLHEQLAQKAREWERKWDERERGLEERVRTWSEERAAQAQHSAERDRAWDDRERRWEARWEGREREVEADRQMWAERWAEQDRRHDEDRQRWEARLEELERTRKEERSVQEEIARALTFRLSGIEERLERVRGITAAAGRMLEDI